MKTNCSRRFQLNWRAYVPGWTLVMLLSVSAFAVQPPNRQFHFTIWSEVVKTYDIESSIDLHTWQPFTNVFNTIGPFQISDPASTSRRFYRVRTTR